MSEREKIVAEGVTVNPERQGGCPCIAGTRIPTWCVKDLAGGGYSVSRIIEEYPDLSPVQIANALAWEARPVRERRELSRCIPFEQWRDVPSVGHGPNP